MPSSEDTKKLLDLVGGNTVPDANEFKALVQTIDSHHVLAKVFLLEGTPFVFQQSPMKYVIFREQVAERFGVGSQDVCIVGSAKLGFSPSPAKYATPFQETSDVDVVIISEDLFDVGSRELFTVLNQLDPPVYIVRQFLRSASASAPQVDLRDWRKVKDAIRNYVYQNFNPGLLPFGNVLREDIFRKIGTTAGLFLALEPKVFVSKIRGRIFRTWRAAEDYYANSLRELKRSLCGSSEIEIESEEIDDAEELGQTNSDAATGSQ